MARDHSDLLRDAVAAGNVARLEARFQQGQESRLEFESAILFRRSSEAAAHAAREEALRNDLESRLAALRAELLASHQEVARLRASREGSPPAPPAPVAPAATPPGTTARAAPGESPHADLESRAARL